MVLLSLSRKEVRKEFGLLTGHCHLRNHLQRLEVSKLCRWCDLEDETAEQHVLLKCEALTRCRLRMMALLAQNWRRSEEIQ